MKISDVDKWCDRLRRDSDVGQTILDLTVPFTQSLNCSITSNNFDPCLPSAAFRTRAWCNYFSLFYYPLFQLSVPIRRQQLFLLQSYTLYSSASNVPCNVSACSKSKKKMADNFLMCAHELCMIRVIVYYMQWYPASSQFSFSSFRLKIGLVEF